MLPVLDTYAFPVTIPSTGNTTSMRPYLVREEKLLLMAQESRSYAEQAEAVAQVIRNCTDNAIEPKVAPFFDIEYLLLQLRARSVGEITTPTYVCRNKISEGTEDVECGEKTTVKVNITNITVSDIPKDQTKIQLGSKYVLKLRYPTIFTVNDMFMALMSSGGETPEQSKVVNKMVDVFDSLEVLATKDVLHFSDYTEAEKIEFLDGLLPSDYQKVVEFIDTMPTLVHKIDFTCAKCNHNHVIVLRGLVDFLAL